MTSLFKDSFRMLLSFSRKEVGIMLSMPLDLKTSAWMLLRNTRQRKAKIRKVKPMKKMMRNSTKSTVFWK